MDYNEKLLTIANRVETEPVRESVSIEKPLSDILNGIKQNQQALAKYNFKPARHPTELGLAEAFADTFSRVVAYEPSLQSWMIWDGKVWTADRDNMVFQAVKQLLRSEGYRAADEERNADHVILAKMERTATIRAILGAAQSEPRFIRHIEDADADPWILNCKNGILDLRTLELRDHTPDDWVTRCTSVDYEPGDYPTFSRFISEITNDRPELTVWLAGFLGLCMTGDISAQIFTIWHGVGSNGKSVLLNLFRNIAGSYAVTISPETLLESRSGSGETPRPDLLEIRGARAVFANESGEGAKLSVPLVKSISGEDQITARPLYGNPVSFTPRAKVVMVSNHKPRIPRMDHAIKRRLRLVPFDRIFGPAERDPRMLDKLMGEAPAILALLAEAASAYYAMGAGYRGLPECSVVDVASERYADSEDIVTRFISECTIHGTEAVQSSRLYETFQKWAESEGEHPLTARAFRNALEERGYHGKRKESGIYFESLMLR